MGAYMNFLEEESLWVYLALAVIFILFIFAFFWFMPADIKKKRDI